MPLDIAGLLAEREAQGFRANGAAMVSRLLRGVVDAGVGIRVATPAVELVTRDGEVVGVLAEHEGAALRIGVRKGVILASGGFEWNAELVTAYLGTPDVFSLTVPGNVGDGLRMGLEVGATVANMTNCVGIPVTYDGHSVLEGRPHGSLAVPRHDPGVIIVNREGRRFMNEGVCYVDTGKAHRTYDPATQSYPNSAGGWYVFDQAVRDRTMSLDLMPGRPTPSWVHEAATIAELATLIDVDPEVLVAQVDRWNAFVDAGEDPEFHRGTIWFEGFQSGGPSPEKNMARIESAPFYAMPHRDGILGTTGGLRTDPDARVRAMRGGVVEGLYAVGNVAANIFGQAYPGGGSTLGPGLTFGYLAGQHAAGAPSRDPGE